MATGRDTEAGPDAADHEALRQQTAALARRRRRRAWTAGATAALLVLLALVAVGWRSTYGTWPPNAPARITYCGHYYMARGRPTTNVARGRPTRTIGHAPAIIGRRVLIAKNRDRQETCYSEPLYRSVGGGRYQQYDFGGGL